MRLASPKEFRSLVFTPATAPSERTVRANIAAKKYPGSIHIAGKPYVDLDVFDRETGLASELLATREALAKSPDLEGLI